MGFSEPLMPIMQSAPGAETVIDGRRFLYFAGTGYLGLQGDARVVEASCDAVKQYGLHAATSRGGFGDSPPVLEVERAAAAFFGAEAAFYYTTGYAGCAILMQSVGRMFDCVFVDSLAHFAAQDAGAASRARVESFNHGDADHLRSLFKQHAAGGRGAIVLCDGVSPVLGDIAPIGDYLSIIDDHGGATLCIDDAHGIGVLGSQGRGTLQWWSEKMNRPIAVNGTDWREGMAGALMCGTLSKAVGGFGGIIPGPAAFIADVKAKTHWFSGASAPPAPVAGATAAALNIVMNDAALRGRLHSNIKLLRDGLRAIGLPVTDSPVPIICLQLGDAGKMARIQQGLAERGIIIAFIRAYSGVGPEGALRIAVFATHTAEMIIRLIDELKRVV